MKKLLFSLSLVSVVALHAQESPATQKETLNSVEWQKQLFETLVSEVARSTGIIPLLRGHSHARRQLVDETVKELHGAIEKCAITNRFSCEFLRRYLKKYGARVCPREGWIKKEKPDAHQELCDMLPLLEAAYNAKNFHDTSLDE